MYNWNTDTTRFKNARQKMVWTLIQQLDYGSDEDVISKKDVLKYWADIKNEIDPVMKRLLEYTLWGKRSCLPIKKGFWLSSSSIQKLPTTFT